MSESQTPRRQQPGQYPPPQKEPAPKEPCEDPKPSDCKPPCPPEEKCPEKPKCSCPPKFDPPDPCAELPPIPPEEDPDDEPEPPPEGDDDCGPASKPTDQLALLQSRLVKSQKTLRGLEPVKQEVDDLETRIKALQELIGQQTQKETDYKAFYRAVEVARSEVECFIPTVRCQLELKEHQKRCVCLAIDKVDGRIEKAKREAERARLVVRHAERAHAEAAARLEWAKTNHDFVTTGLQEHVTALKAELADLKGKVDPSKDQCKAYFYLYELERLIKVCEGCWNPDLNVGTFVECWPPECYAGNSHRTLAAFNDAEADEKLKASQKAQATALAEKLEAAVEAAVKARRADILNEIEAAGCCGPDAKCPPPSEAGRDAR
jgi:hypothetical protein